ncbi:MAG TPA: glycosyltransferase family 9 protein [Candidatus Paceibacterota bacterium]|nr:glycosyltransferase family 9 protein [Candidatus Paceibacterota bacterium]
MNKRITTFLICIVAIGKALLCGRANSALKLPPKNIVAMVLTSNIGDMIFATSVFRAIKEKYPDSHLTVVGSQKNKVTLYGNNDIDEYLVDPKNSWQLIWCLRKIKADYGFSLANSSADIAVMFLSGVKSIACFDVKNAPAAHTKLYRVLKTLCLQVPYYIGNYCSLEYLKILEPLGIFSKNTKKYLFYDQVIASNLRDKLKNYDLDISREKIVAISPGAGTKIKLWPAERFAKVANFLTQQGYRIAVIGGPSDRDEVRLFKSKLINASQIVDASEFSLGELFYFISCCRLLVANDSGPVYIAEAFNVPTLVIVGPTDENEHPPHGPLNFVVTPSREKESPEMRGHIVGYNEQIAREQIERVTVEEVLSVLKILLNNLS